VGAEFARLTDAHIPTGRITVEQVLRLTIELGAAPRREDWEEVMRDAQEKHERYRTWT
jgi:hypothetical protein